MLSSIKGKSLAVLLLVAALSASLLLLAGCGQTFTIGTKINDATKISVKNETGQAITSVTYVSKLAQDGDWDNGVTAELYVDPSAIVVSSESATQNGNEVTTEESDVILEPLTALQFTTADGMTYALHQLNVSDVKDATIKIEDGVAYMEYTSIATGEQVNTLDAELAYQEQVKAAAEAAAQAEDEANAEDEDENKDESANAGTTNSNNSNNSGNTSSKPSSGGNGGGSSSSSGGSNSSGGSASSDEDVCVDDLVLN